MYSIYNAESRLTKIARLIFSGFTTLARVTDIQVKVSDGEDAFTDGKLKITIPKTFVGHAVDKDQLLSTGLLAHEISHWLQPINELNDLVKKERVPLWFVNLCMDIQGEAMMAGVFPMYQNPLSHVRELVQKAKHGEFVLKTDDIIRSLTNEGEVEEARKNICHLALLQCRFENNHVPFQIGQIRKQFPSSSFTARLHDVLDVLVRCEALTRTAPLRLPSTIMDTVTVHRWLLEPEHEEQQPGNSQMFSMPNQSNDQGSGQHLASDDGQKVKAQDSGKGSEGSQEQNEGQVSGFGKKGDEDSTDENESSDGSGNSEDLENPMGDALTHLVGMIDGDQKLSLMNQILKQAAKLMTSLITPIHPITEKKRSKPMPEAVRLSKRITPRFEAKTRLSIMAPGRIKRRDIVRSPVPFEMDVQGSSKSVPSVVLCVDVSGSMNHGTGDKHKMTAAQMVAQAITLAVEEKGGDVIACAFGSDAVLEKDGANLFFRPNLRGSISTVTGYGTSFEFLTELWFTYPDHQVIVVTDGQGYAPIHIPMEYKRKTSVILIPPATDAQDVASWSHRQVVLDDMSRLGAAVAMLVPRTRVG